MKDSLRQLDKDFCVMIFICVLVFIPTVVADCVVEWQLRSLQFCTITNCPAVLAVHKKEPSVLKFKVWTILVHTLLKKKGFISVPHFNICKKK